MKTLIILTIFLSPICLLGQSNNSENYLSVNFQVGYLVPQNTSMPDRAIKGGLEIRPSIYNKISRNVTTLIEFIYCEHKYKTAPDRGVIIDRFINFGIRVYPRTNEQFYLKPSIGYSVENNDNLNIFPNLNFGVGNDFRISNKIDLFGEAEIFFGFNYGSTISFSFSSGIKYKLFLKN